MVSDLVFYQLALIALVGLLVLLQYAWPSRCGAGGHRAAKPITTTRKRSRDPKPFAGFSQKPHCEACEPTAESRPQASCAPPPPIVSTRGRRRQVDTSDPFCPHALCAYHGYCQVNGSRANGTPIYCHHDFG